MSRYRRAHVPGGTFFFTVTLADRSSDALTRHIDRLRRIYGSVQQQRPFETVAICILPDHLHAIWSLPAGDADFAMRWNLIKSGFWRGLPALASRAPSKIGKREKGICSADIGSTRSGTTPTWRVTSIIFISIRSNTGLWRKCAIGRRVAFIAMSRRVYCRRIGVAIFARSPVRLASSRVGTALRAFAHPTFPRDAIDYSRSMRRITASSG